MRVASGWPRRFFRYSDSERRPTVAESRGFASKPRGVFAYYDAPGNLEDRSRYAADRPVLQRLSLNTDKVLDARRGSASADAELFRRWVADDEYETDPDGMRQALMRMGYEVLLLDGEAIFMSARAFRLDGATRR